MIVLDNENMNADIDIIYQVGSMNLTFGSEVTLRHCTGVDRQAICRVFSRGIVRLTWINQNDEGVDILATGKSPLGFWELSK